MEATCFTAGFWITEHIRSGKLGMIGHSKRLTSINSEYAAHVRVLWVNLCLDW